MWDRIVRDQLIVVFEKTIADAIRAGIDSIDYKALTGQEITCITWTVDDSGADTLLINPEHVEHPEGWESRSGNNTAEPSGRSHQRIGPRLLREHELPARKGYFSKTGVPYSRPDEFPAVLFDPDGYLTVNDESSMRNNPYINVGIRISIPSGISAVPGYVACGHTHE